MTSAFAQEAQAPSAPDTVGTDEPGQIDVAPGAIFERIDAWVDGAVKLVPNIVVAVIVVLLFWLIGTLVKRAFLKWAAGRERDNLGEVFGSFLKWVVLGLGILLGLTIIIPTLKPGDLIAGLGVSSVAIGFAFKDILQNWLAGMLLLFRQPFEIGDQIIAQGYEGTVDRIETRATYITTYDGRKAIIPNSEVYTNAVLVNTAVDIRRSQCDVGIGYGDDIDEAMETLQRAVEAVDGIDRERDVEVLLVSLADFSVVLRVRWWTKSPRAEVLKVQSNVLKGIKLALDDAGIDMPYETQVHLIHDQTEASDGKRSKQREGWPAAKEDSEPRYEVIEARQSGG
ncbi:MAG: mechanosensitive ion channel family protein [Pseudomonadota bacterium]